jgi:hypothetical protein
MKIQIRNKPHLINEILTFGAHLSEKKDNVILNNNTRFNKFYAQFHLPIGVSTIMYKADTLHITYDETQNIVGTSMAASKFKIITIEGDNVLDFLEDARLFCKVKKEKTEIITYVFKSSYWSVLSKLPKRSIETLYLPDKVLKGTLCDLERFFNKEELYHTLGIPYKRNYLFEGIHGSGKTSLIFTLASHFDMDLAVMNFNLDVDDATFMKAVSMLPEKSILVLEDIDVLFVERKMGDSNKSMISFSGILNTLDGMGRKNGLITFLTTNYKTKLDKALLRPGRIDNILSFTYAKKGQIQKMFNKFFPSQGEKWRELWKKIKNIKTTIAILQDYFFRYIEEGDILENIEDLKRISEENTVATKDLYL